MVFQIIAISSLLGA